MWHKRHDFRRKMRVWRSRLSTGLLSAVILSITVSSHAVAPITSDVSLCDQEPNPEFRAVLSPAIQKHIIQTQELIEMGEPSRALLELDRLASLKDLTKYDEIVIKQLYAQAYFDLGDYREGISHFEEAVEMACGQLHLGDVQNMIYNLGLLHIAAEAETKGEEQGACGTHQPSPPPYIGLDFSRRDGSPVSQFRVAPEWPPGEVERNIGGCVRYCFTISDMGIPVDIEVIDSSNPVFEAYGRAALEKFHYVPNTARGKAVETPFQEMRFVWQLEGQPPPDHPACTE